MDPATLRPWLVLAHVLGVIAFAMAHGVSATVAIRLRRERDRARLGALLELSESSLILSWVGLLVILISGVAAGIVGGWFTNGQLWLWAAIVLLVAIVGLMYPLALGPLLRLRWMLGLKTREDFTKELGPSPAAEADVAARLDAWNPLPVTIVGYGGLAIVTWLMVMKPF